LYRSLEIPTAEAFQPLLAPARYKAAHGGRGSGKSHFFAGLLVEDHLANPGLRSVCIREVQKSLKESSKRLIEDKIREYGLGPEDGFEILKDEIRTPGGGLIIFQGMQDHTAESIKSLEGFGRAWIEEAQTLSATSLNLLRPTIRAPGSELWFSWNPRRKTDPVDMMLRGGEIPTGSVVVRANWSDNPWLPAELETERQDCLRAQPDQYAHIWEGDYAAVLTGAYYAQSLATAKAEKRIGIAPADPLMRFHACWDIGVSDSTVIWIVQYVGREILFLDYYEAQGQPLSAHLNWLRANGYANAVCVLPHDADKRDAVSAIRFEDHISAAGFEVLTIPNQGKGAAIKRVEVARRLFPAIRFQEDKTQPGLDALGWYHERRDETRNIGLGPEHDWASHAADAFGLACIAFEQTRERPKMNVKRSVVRSSGGWMAA
jgi:phage terminase large subunit